VKRTRGDVNDSAARTTQRTPSRRDFVADVGALAVAAAGLAACKRGATSTQDGAAGQGAAPLPSASALARAQAALVLARYDAYLDAASRADVPRLVASWEKGSAALAAFSAGNADDPSPPFVVFLKAGQ